MITEMAAEDPALVGPALAELRRSALTLEGEPFDCAHAIVEALVAAALSAPQSPMASSRLALAFDLAFGEGAREVLGWAGPIGRAEVYGALLARVGDLVPLLDAPEPSVRAAAAFGLGRCSGDAPDAAKALGRRLAVEDEPAVAATLCVALAVAGRATRGAPGGSLRARVAEPWVASLAALLDAWVEAAAVPPLDEVVAAYARPEVPAELFPWLDGRVGVLCRDLALEAGATRDWFSALLLGALRLYPAQAEGLLRGLGEVALGYEERRQPGDLSSSAKELLRALEGLDSTALGRLGFPRSAAERRRWLSKAPDPDEVLWEDIRRLQGADVDEDEVLDRIRKAKPTADGVMAVVLALSRSEHDLAPLSPGATWASVSAAGESGAPVIDEHLERGHLHDASPEGVLCVLGWVLRFRGAEALDSSALDELPLWQPWEVCRELLQAMTLERREARLLREMAAQQKRPTSTVCNVIKRVLPVVDLACTPRVVDALLEISSEGHLRPLDSARVTREARLLVYEGLLPLAAHHPWLRARISSP